MTSIGGDTNVTGTPIVEGNNPYKCCPNSDDVRDYAVLTRGLH